MLSKIFENRYEQSLKGSNPSRAAFWGKLYYTCLSAIDRRMEGIKDINAAVRKDIESNFFMQHKRPAA